MPFQRWWHTLKDCAGAVKLGDLSVEMRRLSLSSCSFFFFHSCSFSLAVIRHFFRLHFIAALSVVCLSLSLSAVCVVCLYSRLPEKEKKKFCGTNLNWALCCTLSCSMLSSCRKVPSLPVCVPLFQLSWRAAPCGGVCVSCMLACACGVSVRHVACRRVRVWMW